MIPDEFNDERNDWEEHCEYPPEDIVPGERMGVCVGGPEDGHRFPIARVMCECCDGPSTHYACRHEDATAYSVYILDESTSSASQMLSTASIITKPKRVKIGCLLNQWKVRTE